MLKDGEWSVFRVPYPLGFYTKWIWPGLPGVYQPGEPDTEWLDSDAGFARAVLEVGAAFE